MRSEKIHNIILHFDQSSQYHWFFVQLVVCPAIGLSPCEQASSGVYWNQAQKNFTHPLTTQTHTIRRGALRFATQILPLLNSLNLLIQLFDVLNFIKAIQIIKWFTLFVLYLLRICLLLLSRLIDQHVTFSNLGHLMPRRYFIKSAAVVITNVQVYLFTIFFDFHILMCSCKQLKTIVRFLWEMQTGGEGGGGGEAHWAKLGKFVEFEMFGLFLGWQPRCQSFYRPPFICQLHSLA